MADNEHDDDLVDYDEEEVRERIVCRLIDADAGSSSTGSVMTAPHFRSLYRYNSFFGFSCFNVSYIDRR